MKKNKVIIALLAAATGISLASCGKDNTYDDFDFTLSLQTGRTQLRVGESDQLVISTSGEAPADPVYEFTVTNSQIATVSETGKVTGVKAGNVTFTVKETKSEVSAKLNVPVVDGYPAASGGYNYAAAAGAEAIATRTEILGSLEKYAMDSHLTGITLFENGGYVKYHPRLEIPAEEYITGYGFGILSEGSITADLEGEGRAAYKRYLHSASASDPLTINAFNASGSQVSDLASYITSSYWGTKMKGKTAYEWYPVLAKDKVGGKVNDRPIPVIDATHPENPLGLYTKWRIYVKTAADGVKYTTLSSARSAYNERGVAIEDYEFIYQALLTGANKMSRGAEMAGDTSYGIKGAQQYYNNTQSMTDQTQIDAVWNSMKANGSLGIGTGSDTNGSYIDLELVNPIDKFTAMYTLSSSLVSPLPRAFISEIGGGSIIDGMKRYGSFNNGGDDAIMDYTLCLGAYTIEKWTKRQEILFKRNDSWFERSNPELVNRYTIEGVSIRTIENATQNPDAIYNEFNSKNLDSCGIPTLHLPEEMGQPNVYQTKGDSTFKLNVNSCTQEEWDRLNDKIWHNTGDKWDVKPWMSNEDFLAGLYYSINRKEFATKRGVQPSTNYFSDSYLSDPENGVSYNSTETHKEAVKAYQVVVGGEDQYGYNEAKAVQSFKKAVNTLVRQGKIVKGTVDNPQVIRIHIKWMYESDVTEYGEDIKSYFETAFNKSEVSGGTVVLEVTQDAVTNWEDVYNLYLMKGNFDLGFGAISGNTYNPLNFLEVLKSNNSSGFTLNWGTDTSKVDERHPLVYDGKEWSFDALWEVADHGGVVDNGSVVKTVKHCYMESPKTLSGGAATDVLKDGCTVDIPLEFVNVENVELDVTKTQLYIVGNGNKDVTYTYDKANKVIHVTISQAQGAEWNNIMREVNKLRDTDPNPDEKPFIWGKYGIYWTFEVYYTITIIKDGKKGTPSQTYVSVAKNKDAEPTD